MSFPKIAYLIILPKVMDQSYISDFTLEINRSNSNG